MEQINAKEIRRVFMKLVGSILGIRAFPSWERLDFRPSGKDFLQETAVSPAARCFAGQILPALASIRPHVRVSESL
jgi:hypothetical protein